MLEGQITAFEGVDAFNKTSILSWITTLKQKLERLTSQKHKYNN
jgi:hypothetical protein